MKTRTRQFQSVLAAVAGTAFVLAPNSSTRTLRADEPIPSIKGELGPCTADFTVLDPSYKPVYDARISVLIHYGFLGKHDSSLEIGTGSEGKARFMELPAETRGNRPLKFTIKKGSQTETMLDNPGETCHPNYTVVLKGQP